MGKLGILSVSPCVALPYLPGAAVDSPTRHRFSPARWGLDSRAEWLTDASCLKRGLSDETPTPFGSPWPRAVCLTAAAFAQDYIKKPATTDQVALPPAAEVQALAVTPGRRSRSRGSTIPPSSSSPASSKNGKPQDLTGDVKYKVADPAIARVTTAGRVMPLANGTTEITATYGDKIDQGRRSRPRAMRRQPADQLRQPDRADLHQARLQRRRLPRQGGRPERLHAVAARLRAGARLS